MPEKFALIIDAGFLTRKLGRYKPSEETITANDIVNYCKNLHNTCLKEYELFRIYYYDCNPYTGKITNPITGKTENYGSNPIRSKQQALIDELELQDNFAIRKGQIQNTNDWILRSPGKDKDGKYKKIELNDVSGKLRPHITQKQVDMKIGLDIAWLASKKIVDRIVLVTGDADFIPAIKFARKEGLIVYLNNIDQRVNRNLKVHSDYVLGFPEKEVSPLLRPPAK